MSSKQVRDVAYSRYDSPVQVDYARFANVYDRLVTPHVPIEPSWRCLDVACGKGNFLAFLRFRGVRDFTGVDITASAVEAAAVEFGSQHVAHGAVEAFLAADRQKYRFISALDFIEHIQKSELLAFLGAVAEQLEVGGYLLIRTPNASAPFGMSARYNDITHETCFTVHSLADFTSRFGLHAVEFWDDVGAPRSFLLLCRWILWRMLSGVYKACDFIETGRWTGAPMSRNFWMLLRKNADHQ